MKKIILALLILTAYLGGSTVHAATTEQRFMGRLFRAVQSDDSLWYVSPKDGRRYPVKSGSDSLDVIQKNLYVVSKKGFSALQKKVSLKAAGRFVINPVDKKIYYVDPIKRKLFSIGKAEESFNPLWKLAIGISNKDIDTIPIAQNNKSNVSNTNSISAFDPCPLNSKSLNEVYTELLEGRDTSQTYAGETTDLMKSAMLLWAEQDKRAYQRLTENQELAETILDTYSHPLNVFTGEDLWNVRCRGIITQDMQQHAKTAKPSDLRSRSEREARAAQRERQRTLDAIQEQQEKQIKDLKSIKSILCKNRLDC